MVQIQGQPVLKFLRVATHGAINAAATEQIDLESVRSEFGTNFNTLLLVNTHASVTYSVYLDGVKVAFLPANNGAFSFDWQDGIVYTFLKLENNSGATNGSANDVKITVGRTGV